MTCSTHKRVRKNKNLKTTNFVTFWFRHFVHFVHFLSADNDQKDNNIPPPRVNPLISPCISLPPSRGAKQTWASRAPGLSGPLSGLSDSLQGVKQVLWIDTGVCSVLSARRWHACLMSAWLQRNAPKWRHFTGSTFGSPWKQLPLPWHPLTAFSKQTLVPFSKSLPVFLSSSLSLRLLFMQLVTLNGELEVWNSVQRAFCSGGWY